MSSMSTLMITAGAWMMSQPWWRGKVLIFSKALIWSTALQESYRPQLQTPRQLIELTHRIH